MTPIWEGLFGEDASGPHLVAAKCRACGALALERREICPACWSDDLAAAPVGRFGRVYTLTVVHAAPAGFSAPLRVGYVDLDEELRVFAHLSADARIGDRVRLTIEPLKEGRAGPRYVPA